MYKPRKELGQNFLTDFEVAHKMVQALNVQNNDLLVEIGAGLGALTEEISLAMSGTDAELHAVEIDSRFINKLKAMYLQNMNLNVIEADILQWLPTFKPTRPFKIIGSLPYYITSPIVHSIVRHPGHIEICVLLMQKEVGRKIASVAPKASYLSTFIHTFFDVEFIDIVPREKFSPVPKVDGGIIKFTRKQGPDFDLNDKIDYEDFLHKGFSKPRKMLNKIFSKEFLADLKTDEKLRPQHIEVDKWIEMYFKQKTKNYS